MAALVKNPRIVLGLDYGTTYTGLAWMETDGQTQGWVTELKVFRDWPEKTAQKVPSAYSYSKTPSAKQREQWGYSINEDSQVIRWTKLDIGHRTTSRELEVLRELATGLDLVNKLHSTEDDFRANDVPQHLSKDSSDVIRDYLGKVARKWYQSMSTGPGRNALDNVPLDIVVTHPASWPYKALNATFRAVTGAFHRGMFPTLRNISFTSEPEACALYTVQDMLMRDRNSLIQGECFVLCDAGGGTVDIVSYYVESIEPLKLSRVGGVSGGKYGATFIDQAFLEWLHPRLGNADIMSQDFNSGGHFILLPKGRVLLDRFERIKHAFSGTESGDISLPRGTIVTAGQQDDLESGVISLKAADLTRMFERSVRGTVRMISRQVVQVENEIRGQAPCQVTNIFLSGGFAESKYLFNEVRKYANAGGLIQVQRAEDCWSGVVKGAVLRGMGIGMSIPLKVNACPRHYGICVSDAYADYKHDAESAIIDRFSGLPVIPSRLFWLVHKGDVILPDAPIKCSFPVTARFPSNKLPESGGRLRITFVSTVLDNTPTALSHLPKDENEAVDLDIPLRDIPRNSTQKSSPPGRGRSYLTAELLVEFEISQTVEVVVKFGDMILQTHSTSL